MRADRQTNKRTYRHVEHNIGLLSTFTGGDVIKIIFYKHYKIILKVSLVYVTAREELNETVQRHKTTD